MLLTQNKKTVLILFITMIFLEILDFSWKTNDQTKWEGSLFLHTGLVFCMLALLFILFRGNWSASRELSNSNKNLNNIFDTLDVAIWSHDLKSDVLLITPGIENLYGYPLNDFYQDTLLWKKVIYPEDMPVLEERAKNLGSGQACVSIYRIIRPDGQVRWIQDRGIPTLDEHGEMTSFTSVLFDITNRKESEDQYRSLVDLSPDIIAVISNQTFDYINEAGSRLIGAESPADILNQHVSRFTSDENIRMIRKGTNGSTSGERFELTVYRLNGDEIELEISAMPILYGGRMAIQLIGRDITNRKKAEKTIHAMAYYDSLTGLPNRNKFKQHLSGSLRDHPDQPMAILFLDLDRFKVINDTKGHTTGDAILGKVAFRLKKVVSDKGIVFRQGGDEFIIILSNMSEGEVAATTKEILQSFIRPIFIQEQEFFVTPSIGISMYPMDGKDQESLIKHADTAMYLAKEQGKNNYQFYYPELERASSRNMEIENGLRKVLEFDQLCLHYQPKVDLATRNIIGVEALIRWHHPTLGMVSPAEFIPLAEETGLIVPIGEWVIREACKQSKEWEETGMGIIPVAVNISVRQMKDGGFVEMVKGILAEYEFKPDRLELEITESIMQDFEISTNVLNLLKKVGVMISMDDFGTGYSSLSNLRHLPIDSIKIDKSFVDDIMEDSNQVSIVKAIIDMSQNMNFTTIAEGIETENQMLFLKRNGCQVGQGYHFSRPLPASELRLSFLETRTTQANMT
ncbi:MULTISPECIES: EAL domain-containing protein [Rossellomorea]|uniref:bifunctional diguanylate cyclase/phosphodiesterase n=1 Tax=Rossellomorea TaxID=2837508 RepID=UPI001CCB861D|nr:MULTISPECIES: EAL domain-containing protein [Rossellomorea]MCA0149381.1 EAL domain-containing protein [Rossellomorea vietnamensis]WGG46810.1 EAL domain-containing protein [Rossellomorea sp. DA94]